MASIGLICEGVSESTMISYIIRRYMENVDVNVVQPKISQNGSQDSYGGWRQVLEHCNDEQINNILVTNDALVIQIDTDTCNEKGYDVNALDENHKNVSDEILYERVVERLTKKISPIILSTYSERIIFAICFNETECWLLPLFYNEHKKRCATKNCIYILNQGLQRHNHGVIPLKDKNSPQAQRVYGQILRLLKKKDIAEISQYNYGFKKFIEQLDSIKQLYIS